jgi:hypothetical protein
MIIKKEPPVKQIVLATFTLFTLNSNAADPCSIGLAKKFADGIIAVELEENPYSSGRLIFNRSESYEYTLAYLEKQIDLIGESSENKYTKLKQEIASHPRIHIYRLKYTWDADNKLDLGFYYYVRLNNYERGCALESIIAD